MNPIRRCRALNGFSLVELMLSLSLGLGISGVMLQGLMAEGQNGARFSGLLREQASQRRALELIKGDLAQALAVSTTPALEEHACNLAGRTPLLHLRTAAGPITYSVGDAPSSIWRGEVLMRCGPAFGLDGRMTTGSQAQNRVLVDGLMSGSGSSEACVNGGMSLTNADWVSTDASNASPLVVCQNIDLDLISVAFRGSGSFGTVGLLVPGPS